MSTPTPQRGLLIVLEGLDRSGKSTQCKLLHSHLAAAGHDVKLMRFPDRTTPTGIPITTYLTTALSLPDQTIHLLFSANRWEAYPSMRAALLSGTTLIVDRYSYSGAVYSAAKENPELSLEWAWRPEVGLIRPDVVVFLNVSESVQGERGGWGEERYEGVEMQRRVRREFAGLMRGRLGMREEGEGRELWEVDGGGSVEEVRGVIKEVVEGVWGRKRGGLRMFGNLRAEGEGGVEEV